VVCEDTGQCENGMVPMKTPSKILLVVSLLVLYYIMSYCCIYNSVVIFEITKPYNPEYRSVDLLGSDYSHAYVHVFGYDLFLNPFREYDDTYRVRTTTEEFINAYPNWGQLYVPVLDKFVTVLVSA